MSAAMVQAALAGKDVNIPDSGMKEEHDDVSPVTKHEEEAEKPRGRRRSRAHSTKDSKGVASAQETEKANSSGEDGEEGPDGQRKRRRSRKGLDKKFPCKDCEKSYSRAEHL